MIPVILAIICICFLLIHLAPGDPATILAGETATDEYIAELKAQFGLDLPLWRQLLIYIKNTLQGNLGNSFTKNLPVSTMLAEKMKVTLVLVLLSEVIAIVVGTLLGMVAAQPENKVQDHIISNASMILYCMPTFWLGMMLILIFSIDLKWFPTSGMVSFNTRTPRTRAPSAPVRLSLWKPSSAATASSRQTPITTATARISTASFITSFPMRPRL